MRSRHSPVLLRLVSAREAQRQNDASDSFRLVVRSAVWFAVWFTVQFPAKLVGKKRDPWFSNKSHLPSRPRPARRDSLNDTPSTIFDTPLCNNPDKAKNPAKQTRWANSRGPRNAGQQTDLKPTYAPAAIRDINPLTPVRGHGYSAIAPPVFRPVVMDIRQLAPSTPRSAAKQFDNRPRQSLEPWPKLVDIKPTWLPPAFFFFFFFFYALVP